MLISWSKNFFRVGRGLSNEPMSRTRRRCLAHCNKPSPGQLFRSLTQMTFDAKMCIEAIRPLARAKTNGLSITDLIILPDGTVT